MSEKKSRHGANTLIPHRFENGVEEKFCIVCEVWKQLPDFHTSKKASDGLYSYCKDCSRAADRARYRVRCTKGGSEWQRRREYFREYAESGRLSKVVAERYRRIRGRVIAAYGGKCCKCGFADPRALHVDHVNGDGGKERKGRSPAGIMRRIVKEGFPPKYQLLCANCNTIKMYENREFPGWASHDGGISHEWESLH